MRGRSDLALGLTGVEAAGNARTKDNAASSFQLSAFSISRAQFGLLFLGLSLGLALALAAAFGLWLWCWF